MARSDSTNRFYELIWPHMATVLRTANYLTHRAVDAEDLAQETMLKAFAALDQLRDADGARPWLLTILRRTHIDRIRAGKHQEESLDQLETDPPDPATWTPQEQSDVWNDPESALAAFSDQEMIDSLRTLPRDIRWTLLLVDVEGLDHADTARILDVPIGTVKSRCHRGRRMLRDRLVPPDVGKTASTAAAEPPATPLQRGLASA